MKMNDERERKSRFGCEIMDQKLTNYAFIDANNLYLGVKAEGWFIDYQRLRRYLQDQYQIGKAFMFVGFLEENQGLCRTLQEAGFILIFKEILFGEGKVKGNCDAELVLHAMIEYSNFHQAVLVTGDGDFACLVRYLTEQNKLATVLAPSLKNSSVLLRKAAGSRFAVCSALRNKVEYKKKNTP